MQIEDNKLINSKELFLIILLLRYQSNKDTDLKRQIESLASDNSIMFDEFVKLVEFHKVYTHVYDTVKYFDIFPIGVIEKLKQLNEKNIRKSLAITAELKKLNKFLGRSNISFIVFKGQPLSIMLYGNTHQRISKDIDILIEQDDLEKVLEIFEREYKILDSTKLPLKHLKNYYDHIAFINSKTSTVIEVHWKLLNNEYLAPKFNNAAVDNTVQINISGEDFKVLSFQYNLLYFIIHGAQHHWFRLFWLKDLAQFCLSEKFCLNELIKLGKQYNVDELSISSLLLCYEIFDLPSLKKIDSIEKNTRIFKLNKSYKKKIQYSQVDQEAAPYKTRMKMKFNQLREGFLLQRGIKYKLKVLDKNFIIIRDIETLPLPEKLFFLYYPLHLILAAVKWYRLRREK